MPDGDPLSCRLQAALRRYAKSVVVISCSVDGKRYAIAATAVSEVSLDPPMMLACVNRASSIHHPLASRADFCLNTLGHSQSDISRMCSGKARGEQRFSQGEWTSNADDVPYLADAQSNIFCRTETILQRGTHSIFIAGVTDVLERMAVAPLIYLDGQYASIAQGAIHG